MKALVIGLAALSLAACNDKRSAADSVGPAGYGYSGKIVPVYGWLADVPQSSISDPDAVASLLRSIESNAPPAPSPASRGERDRAIWDARLGKVPAAGEYLLTFQCGPTGRYLEYRLNSGEAQVSLIDLADFERTKNIALQEDQTLLHEQSEELILAASGVHTPYRQPPETPLDEYETAARNLPLRGGAVMSMFRSPLVNVKSKTDLRRSEAGVNEAQREYDMEFGKQPPDTSSIEPEPLAADMAEWRQLPFAPPVEGLMVSLVPLRGGIADICLVAEFSNVDVNDDPSSAGNGASLWGELDAWYLVRRSDGAVVGQTPINDRHQPFPMARP